MKPMTLEQARYIGDLRDKSAVSKDALEVAAYTLRTLGSTVADRARRIEIGNAIDRLVAA